MDVSDSKVGAHRHVDFVYVLAATGGELTAQLEEVGGTRWVPLADVAGLPSPAELPALVDAAARWAKARIPPHRAPVIGASPMSLRTTRLA
jgi:hypothetical protein